jgi:Concanavalin A-like lectin/glucanases superfamily
MGIHSIQLGPPALSISFDGTLVTNHGRNPLKSFRAEYIGYKMRKALKLLPENILTYDVSSLDLHRGAIEFWIKLDSKPPDRPVSLIRIAGKHAPYFEIVLQERTVAFVYKQDPESQPQYLKSKQAMLSKGAWNLWTFTWDATEKYEMYVEIYCNGEPVKTEYQMEPLSLTDSNLVEGLSLGIAPRGEFAEPCVLDLRDPVLWPSLRTASEAAESFSAEYEKMQKQMKWSAVDLYHFAGKKAKDADAKAGLSWTTDTEIAKSDAVKIPETGEYQFNFRMKPLTKILPANLVCEVWSKTPGGGKSTITSWKNNWTDPKNQETYQTISLPFHASKAEEIYFDFQSYIPSKYSLLLDTATIRSSSGNWETRHRFEDLQHTMGVWKEDPEAAGGKGWTNANTLHYGPYVCLGQPGKYRATWRLKVARNVDSNIPLLLLDVFAHDGFFPDGRRGHKSYAKLGLSSSDFKERERWESKSVEFNYDGANMMEFRAFAYQLQPEILFIDTITVESLQ